MGQRFDSNWERTATARANVSDIEKGWTVHGSTGLAVGNVSDMESERLLIDGRPEGLGFFSVPVANVSRAEDGTVYLDLDPNQIREIAGLEPVTSTETSQPVTSGSIRWDEPGPAAGPSGSPRQTAPDWTEYAQSGESAPASRTTSSSPAGMPNTTRLADNQDPRGHRPWDEDMQSSGGSMVPMLLGPVGLGVASAAGYMWWRNRQMRRSRMRRLSRALGSAGVSMMPLLTTMRGRRRSWWLASLAALPLMYYARSAGDGGAPEAPARLAATAASALMPQTTWRDRLPSMPAMEMRAMDGMEAPPLWTMAVPIFGAGLAAALFASRRSRRMNMDMGMKRLGDIMTRDVQVVRPDAPAFEAASTMRRLNVGALPVCDGRRLRGMVTDRDIVMRVVADSRDPQVATVHDAMTGDIIYAHEDDSLERGAQLMRQHQIRRLPIVDRDKNLVGIVSLGDLAVDSGRDRMTGETLERISEPARPRR